MKRANLGAAPDQSYEDRLGEALVVLLGRRAETLEAFCAGLKGLGVPASGGKAWTPAALEGELKRLGANDENATADRDEHRTDALPRVAEPFFPQPKTPEELLETGLLNLWYLVARASDVADKPVSLRRLSRNLVLWRDAQGKVHILEDYCPHRGAPLSMGHIVGGNIACCYHGVTLNGEGVVLAVPPTPDSPLVGTKAIKTYPCREFAGAIWAYFADEAHADAEPPEPVFPEEVASSEWTSFLYVTQWNVNWQISLDNRTDPVHGSFLHGGTFTLSYGRKDAELEVKPIEHGFETWRNNQKNTNIDWHKVQFRPDNALWVTTEIPYPPAIGGGAFRINGAPTPIDRDNTLVYFYRSRKLSGWQRDMWRFLYVNRLEAHARVVVEQDRALLERISLQARKREDLIRTDVAVQRMRRLLHTEAQRQLDTLAKGAPHGG